MTEASDIVRISTADGATLAARRRRGDGPPVLMLHGLAVNAALWDLPTIEGPGFVFRSLATELQERGYDVWLLNFRGHGAPSMLSRPPAGQSDWSLDEFVVFDLPAAIEHVRRETQRAPFVVGASMGSMVAAAWLTGLCRDADVPRGAESAGVKVSVSPGVEAPVSGGVDASSRGGAGWPGAAALRIDPLAAAARQRSIAGVVLVEFPAALRWPRSMYDEAGRPRWDVLLREFWRNDGDANFPFEVLARLGWLEALVTAAGGVPLERLRPDAGRASLIDRLPPRLAGFARRAELTLASIGLKSAALFTGHLHHRPEVLLRGRRYVVDGMKAGVLRQLARCVRRGAFVSGSEAPELVISDHYASIASPALVVAGGRDRIANAGVTREAFFEAIRSPDKEFLLFEDLAHGEFEAAPVATERVYPRIAEWLERRAGGR